MLYISKTVWILSIISLLSDTASEMLYPIMPIYLQSIGFSIVLIGVLEGIAEATAGLSKSYFGKLSDTSYRRAPFVQLGYILSTISKPMMVIFTYPFWIFFSRTLDRFGKGIRTGARDAILSDESTHKTKGRIFGLHRSMDAIGAVLGPSLALIYLYFYPQDYVTLFLLSFIPGVIAVLFSLFIKDKKITEEERIKHNKISFSSFFKYWKSSPKQYKRIVIGLLAFSLFNGSDVFLLLKAREAGVDETLVIGMYIFYNLIYALVAFPIGFIGDKIGLKYIFIVGLLLFTIMCFGMAFNTDLYIFFFLFFIYGVYVAATEGLSKAWISNIVDEEYTATAIGTFSGLQSITTLLASTITGFVWFHYGSITAFFITGLTTITVMIYFMFIPNPQNKD